jgi:molecular chaperone GrpE
MQEEKVQPQPSGNEEDTRSGEKSLEELLAEAQAQIETQRDALLRAVADAENTRKRVQAEATTSQKFAIERFAESLLPVVDSLEAAVAAMADAPQAMREGVELTLRQLLGAFEKVHLRAVEARPGDRFDPYRHQAMAAVPSEAEPNSIVSVMQKGYALHERVLRPTLVTVARAIENPAENPISDTDSN